MGIINSFAFTTSPYTSRQAKGALLQIEQLRQQRDASRGHLTLNDDIQILLIHKEIKNDYFFSEEAAILRAILSQKAIIHLTPSVSLSISQNNGKLNVRNRLRTAKFHTQNISAKCPSKPVTPFC
jgi:hypothetical protein